MLALLFFVGIRYDYYYDLNDDVLIKDILAGVYTGMPEGNNIQMHWPISFLISLCYRLVRQFPWYGLFLCLCHFGSLYLIACRSLRFCGTRAAKAGLLLVEGSLMLGLFLEHLVFAQYTLTCTLLASAAAFWFFTTDDTLDTRVFIRDNIPAILLVSLAYVVRSEMLLLVLPMICAAGVIKWGNERKIFVKENFVKYLAIIGGILAGIGLGQGLHALAYSSQEWRAFTEYFDNRTELYDFQRLPEYEENQDFYESIGLTESERELLDNYNFGLDEKIDEKLIGQVASYAAENRSEEKPFFQQLRACIPDYIYRTLHGKNEPGSDYPWNYAVIAAYGAVFLVSLLKRKNILGVSWKLAFLFAVRTVLWMYILMRERKPPRILHSLYLMELCILGAMLLVSWKNTEEGKHRRIAGIAAGILFLVLGISICPYAAGNADINFRQREVINAPFQELYGYLGDEENRNNFYFLDVYSTVAYSEKMFENVDNSLDNYDLMGGWACKSPLWKKKLALFGIRSVEEALLEQENVFFVIETGGETDWLKDYYEDQGKEIRIEELERIGDGFIVYDIRKAG